MVSTLSNVGEYDNYIVEVRYPDDLDDEITETLEKNLEAMGSSIGEKNVYVKPFDTSVIHELLTRLDREEDMTSMPWLLLVDKHPTEIVAGDECMVFELGGVKNSQGVTRTFRELRKAMTDERFARRLTIKQKLDRMKNILSKTIETGGLVVTAATFL